MARTADTTIALALALNPHALTPDSQLRASFGEQTNTQAVEKDEPVRKHQPLDRTSLPTVPMTIEGALANGNRNRHTPIGAIYR